MLALFKRCGRYVVIWEAPTTNGDGNDQLWPLTGYWDYCGASMVFIHYNEFTELIQGDPKKMSHKDSWLKSVLEVRFYFSAGVLESENWSRFIWLLQYYPFRIKSALKSHKLMRGYKFILFSHHQFNTRLRYIHAVPFLVGKFFTMFFSWTVVFHLWGQFSKKGEMIQFSRCTPISLDNIVGSTSDGCGEICVFAHRLWRFRALLILNG